MSVYTEIFEDLEAEEELLNLWRHVSDTQNEYDTENDYNNNYDIQQSHHEFYR